MLDLQPEGGTTAAGYEPFEAANQANPSAASHSYSAFGTTITVNLTTANLPDGNLDFRAVARSGPLTEVYNDWLGVDTRADGVDVTMSLEFVGLPAGDYNWLSYHEDGIENPNGNLDGGADYFLAGKTGTITFSTGGGPISTLSETFSSDGVNPVTFTMVMDNGQLGEDPSAVNRLFAFAGGVEVSVIPEPSTLALIGLGLLGLAVRRRRA